MNDIERVLRAILTELKAIRVVIAPDKKPKSKSGSSVAAFNTVTGESGDLADLPSQLEHGFVESGPMRRHRRVVRFKGGDPRGD